ncbi:MAG TPA: hypothetical protein VGK56_18375 [Anaerolineales bacterium]
MPSLQDALTAAFDKEAAELEPTPSKDLPAEGAQNELPTPEAAEEVKPEASAVQQRERDETGKFKARTEHQVPAAKEPTEKEVKPVAQQPQQPAGRAPVSWRPEIREKFGALPPEIQAEVSRREREIESGLREAAGSRRFHEEFARTIQPYEAMLRSEQAAPLEAVAGLLNTAYQLRTAAPHAKAVLVAKIITDFGVDISMLDDVLSGTVENPGQQARRDPNLEYIQRTLAPVQQFMERFQGMEQQVQQTTAQRAADAIAEFKKKPEVAEFYEDVSEDMADLMEMSARRGQKITLQDAFNRAIMAHPEISKILADRRVAATAQQSSSAAQRARAASASLPSGSAPGEGSGKLASSKDLTSAIAQAWDTVENRMS